MTSTKRCRQHADRFPAESPDREPGDFLSYSGSLCARCYAQSHKEYSDQRNAAIKAGTFIPRTSTKPNKKTMKAMTPELRKAMDELREAEKAIKVTERKAAKEARVSDPQKRLERARKMSPLTGGFRLPSGAEPRENMPLVLLDDYKNLPSGTIMAWKRNVATGNTAYALCTKYTEHQDWQAAQYATPPTKLRVALEEDLVKAKIEAQAYIPA